jgi:vitamin B12 transporter
MRRYLLLTSALALAPMLHARAQQPNANPNPTGLPETIVTATRIPTPAERVPAAITVLTRQDIEERGYQTLAEALRAVPGMNVVQLGGPGQPSSAFVRGSNSNHVLVLLDGVPVNDPSEPNGAFNFGNDLLFDIERIEVVRGPASSLYGSAAIGGVVNLVTRRAAPDRVLQSYGEVAGGTERTLRGGLGVMGQVGAVDYLFSGNGLQTRGFDVTPTRLAGDTGERDALRGGAGTARIGVRLDAGTRVEALLRWRENKLDYDNVPRDDPNLESNDRRWYGQLRGETTLLGGAWTTGLRAAVTQDRRIYINRPDPSSASNTRDTYEGERRTLDWGNRVTLPDLGPLTASAVAFGATFTEDRVESGFGTGAFRTATDARTSAAAVHAGWQARLLERLDVSFGLRHDEAEDFEGFTSWRAGAVYALPELSSRLRVAGGTAFRAPTLYQRFGRSSSFRGNPDLQAEDSIGWEVGIETDVAAFGRPNFATFSATWFESEIRNLIVFNSNFTTLQNVQRAEVEGAELGLTLRLAAWLDVQGSWTITDSRNADTERRLLRRPENTYALSARIAPLPGLVIVPELAAASQQVDFVYPSAGQPGFGRNADARGGQVWNLTVTYAATEQIGVFAEARNLANSRYEPANGFVTPGRSLLVGTRFAF